MTNEGGIVTGRKEESQLSESYLVSLIHQGRAMLPLRFKFVACNSFIFLQLEVGVVCCSVKKLVIELL